MSSDKGNKSVGISTKVSVDAATTGEGLASVTAEDRSPAATHSKMDASQVEGTKRRRRHKMSGAQERKLRKERARLRASEAEKSGTSQTGPLPEGNDLSQKGPPKANDPSKRGTLPKEGNPSQKGTHPKAGDQLPGSQSNLRRAGSKGEAATKKKKRFSWTPLERTLMGKREDTTIPGSSGSANMGLRPSTIAVNPVAGIPNPPRVDHPLMKQEAPKLKRGRSDEEATPTSKRKKEASTPKTFAQVVREKTEDTFIRVAVVDSGAPGGKLTEERQVLLQNALDAAFDAAIDASAEGLPVRFAWSGFRRGFFRATCMDRFTVDFLKEQIAGMGRLWDDCNLQVVGKNEIPRLFKVSVTVRGKPRPTADILSCLKKQNGLRTELWEVHHRKEEEDSVFLVFGVDQGSFKWLNEKDGLVPFRLTSLKFRPGCKPPSEQPTSNEADPKSTSEQKPITGGAEITQSSSGKVTSKTASSTLRAPGRAATPTPISSEEECAILGDLSSDEESTMTEEMEEEATR